MASALIVAYSLGATQDDAVDSLDLLKSKLGQGCTQHTTKSVRLPCRA